jgi:excinuclease Cho
VALCEKIQAMRRKHDPSSRRESGNFTPYEYPAHLREAIEHLPQAPGVYVFHGEEGDLPLYIGKSVQLRSRVLSHFRTVSEARMLRQTRRISYVRTAGEVGALLLEAQMIKLQQPLWNQKLRRNRQLCSLSLRSDKPEVVYSKDVNFARESHLFGLFSSRHGALEMLRQLADEQKLCYGALGLEKLPPGKPCFRAMLHQCAGVCRGEESLDAHHARLFSRLADLQIACWPFGGAVGIVERFEELFEIHVVRNWAYLGSATSMDAAKQLDSPAAGFDADGYKILCKPILTGAAEVVCL